MTNQLYRHIADLEKIRSREEKNQAALSLQLTEASDLLSRLVTCADNGYDTAELHDIVAAARGIL